MAHERAQISSSISNFLIFNFQWLHYPTSGENSLHSSRNTHHVLLRCWGCSPSGPAHLVAISGTLLLDASNMLSIASSSIALYSASDCSTDNPSASAREKLATTP